LAGAQGNRALLDHCHCLGPAGHEYVEVAIISYELSPSRSDSVEVFGNDGVNA
jgi:hypothetical protein